MRKIHFIGAAALALTLTACLPETNAQSVPAKVTQAQKAQAVADSIQFTENAEIDNIKRRLELTSQPGLLGYVVLMNEAGQPVWYGTVTGKVTSGSKRLTPPDRVMQASGGYEKTNSVRLAAPSDEGTYGSSNPYVYFWTTGGAYMQWSGHYLYSDKPFRLSVQPLVVDIQTAKPTQ